MMSSVDQQQPVGGGPSAFSGAGVELLPGHSRNSSGTSHSGSGSASGYGSLNSHSQHSRQSSSGELGHFRYFSLNYQMSCPFFVFKFVLLAIWVLQRFFICLSRRHVFCSFVLCRFPSWPVWSPRFSKLRLSKRGGSGVPAGPPANTPLSNNPTALPADSFSDPVEPVRCRSCSRVSPLMWRPLSPLSGRPTGGPLIPSPDLLITPAAAAAALLVSGSALIPSHDSSGGHSRYNIIGLFFFVCFLLTWLSSPRLAFLGYDA